MQDSNYQHDKQQQGQQQSRGNSTPNFSSDGQSDALRDTTSDSLKTTRKRKKNEQDKIQAVKVVHKAATDGSKHIAVEWFWECIDGNYPCGWHITTKPSNTLTAEVRQLQYKKQYAGTGKISTQLVPVAPIGTQSTLTITDTTTGEQMEIIATWRTWGSSFWSKVKEWIFGKKD